jgi:1-deoxy-D-xylulose-5-phosphate reductoisomerase
VIRIAVLGSTGSIGKQTIDVARQHSDRIQVVGLVAGSNAEALKTQSAEFPSAKLALFQNPANADIPFGNEAIAELVSEDSVDMVVVAVAGVIGLLPTIIAIEAKKNIALASKEVLVAAGEIVMPMVRKMGVNLTPIDSEHSAVFQCIQGYREDQIDEVILTASGGPFRGWNREQLSNVSVADALNHPTWNMGGKITIDSATLMNKALEMIEAKWLFGLEMDKVTIVVHPQSIIHSMVRFTDGSVLGQMGWPNMRLPIQYALMYPERPESGLRSWDPIESGSLSFEKLDASVFRGPDLAREAVRIGKTMPCALNAANEEAANAFLRGEIEFLEIQDSVERVMQAHQPETVTLESLLETDKWAREQFQRTCLRKTSV